MHNGRAENDALEVFELSLRDLEKNINEQYAPERGLIAGTLMSKKQFKALEDKELKLKQSSKKQYKILQTKFSSLIKKHSKYIYRQAYNELEFFTMKYPTILNKLINKESYDPDESVNEIKRKLNFENLLDYRDYIEVLKEFLEKNQNLPQLLMIVENCDKTFKQKAVELAKNYGYSDDDALPASFWWRHLKI